MPSKCGAREDSWKFLGSKESILREINPEYLLEGLMLKRKLQEFVYMMQTADTLEKSLMLGKIEGRKRRGHQRLRWLDGVTDIMDMNLGQTLGDGEGQGGLACCSPWGGKELDMTGWLNNNNGYYLHPSFLSIIWTSFLVIPSNLFFFSWLLVHFVTVLYLFIF